MFIATRRLRGRPGGNPKPTAPPPLRPLSPRRAVGENHRMKPARWMAAAGLCSRARAACISAARAPSGGGSASILGSVLLPRLQPLQRLLGWRFRPLARCGSACAPCWVRRGGVAAAPPPLLGGADGPIWGLDDRCSLRRCAVLGASDPVCARSSPSTSVGGLEGGSYAMVTPATRVRCLGQWVCRSATLRVLLALVRLRGVRSFGCSGR